MNEHLVGDDALQASACLNIGSEKDVRGKQAENGFEEKM